MFKRREDKGGLKVLTLGSPVDVKECLRGYEETKSREGKLDITKQTANSRLLEHPWPRTLHTAFQIQSKNITQVGVQSVANCKNCLLNKV